MISDVSVDDVDEIRIAPKAWLSFRDDQVRETRAIVARTGILERYEAWRADERARLGRHAGGAPESFPLEPVIVALVLAADYNRPLLGTELRDIMFLGMSPRMRAELGIPDPPALDDRRAWDSQHRTVLRRLHSLFTLVDPSTLPKNRRLSPEDFEAAVERHRDEEQLTDDVLAERDDRLAWVANQFIGSGVQVPGDLRPRWKGSVAVDATPVPAFSRPSRRRKSERENRPTVTYAADPDADWYVRRDSRDADGTTDGHDARKAFWAYEATLIVTRNEDPTSEVDFPQLVLGMAPLHKPNKDIGKNAITALASVRDSGHPAGLLTVDRAYTHARPETFQLPARALGYELVLDYRDDQLGVQASHAGALLVEGGWYCPGIPPELINATRHYRKGDIDEGTYHQRIEARRALRLRPKATPDAEGHVRMMCPAANGAPTARCELKPDSITDKTAGLRRIPLTDALRVQPPKVCTQQSVTFPPDAGAKLVQPLHYGSAEWRAHFTTPRNTNEGLHGVLKDGAYAALDDPERRRIRGVAAQTIFTAVLIMAANRKAIRSFIGRSRPDSEGVLRRPRRRRRTTEPLERWRPETAPRAGAPPA